MSDPTVLYSEDGHVALIALNRPDALNASTKQLRADLRDAMTRAEENADIRVVVITGEGRGFSAGADLTEGFLDEHATVTEHILKDHKPLIDRIGASEKTYIAALNGPTAGISVGYALNCDLVIMAESAYIYSPFAAIALVPDGGVSWFLLQRLGYYRAYQMIVECERLNSNQCLDLGFVNKVAPDSGFRESALEWARQLATQTAPLVLKNAKKILRVAREGSLEDTIQLEAEFQHTCISSEDAAEGAAAFFEKRKPNFKGK